MTEIPRLLEQWLSDVGLFRAALIYIVIYAVRPLILFPATLLTVASGLIFGPWLGTLFTVVGENSSANLGFVLVRWLGRDTVKAHSTEWLSRWDEKLKQNGIVSDWLAQREPGDKVLASAPFGWFRPGRSVVGERCVFIATGTGPPS